jgi:hypothetical protein
VYQCHRKAFTHPICGLVGFDESGLSAEHVSMYFLSSLNDILLSTRAEGMHFFCDLGWGTIGQLFDLAKAATTHLQQQQTEEQDETRKQRNQTVNRRLTFILISVLRIAHVFLTKFKSVLEGMQCSISEVKIKGDKVVHDEVASHDMTCCRARKNCRSSEKVPRLCGPCATATRESCWQHR